MIVCLAFSLEISLLRSLFSFGIREVYIFKYGKASFTDGISSWYFHKRSITEKYLVHSGSVRYKV